MQATKLLARVGDHVSGTLNEVDSSGPELRLVVTPLDSPELEVVLDDPLLREEFDSVAEEFFQRHPDSTLPGVTLAHDERGAARLDEFGAPEDAVAWVVVLRYEGERNEEPVGLVEGEGEPEEVEEVGSE